MSVDPGRNEQGGYELSDAEAAEVARASFGDEPEPVRLPGKYGLLVALVPPEGKWMVSGAGDDAWMFYGVEPIESDVFDAARTVEDRDELLVGATNAAFRVMHHWLSEHSPLAARPIEPPPRKRRWWRT